MGLGGSAVAGDQFGFSIAADGGVGLVGAVGRPPYTGGLFLYDIASLAQVREYTSSILATGDGMGYSVALGRGWVYAGAPYRNGIKGSVIVFPIYSSTVFEVLRPYATANDYFG